MFNFISVEVYCWDLNEKPKKTYLQYKTILYLYFLSFFGIQVNWEKRKVIE